MQGKNENMTIGISGPMTLAMLNFDWEGRPDPPKDTYSPIIARLINVLLSLGYKVVAYTTSSAIESEMVYEGKQLTICIAKRHKKASMSLFTLYYLERKGLARLMKKYPADIINAQWSYEYAWGAIDSGIPTVVTVRDIASIIYQYFKDRYRWGRWIVNDIILWKSKYLTANSQYTFHNLTKRQQQKAIVIPNYYNPTLEKSYQPQLSKQPYVISICSFDHRKNIANGLRAFSIIRKRFPHYQYYLLGVGMKKYGEPYAIEQGLADGVLFFEQIPFDEVIPMVREAKVLLHPSLEESFGLAVLEGMVVGTPVIGGHESGNVPHLLKHKQTGMLCDVTNPEAIAGCMAELISDEELYAQIVAEAHKFAKEHYSMDVIVPRLVEYYREILSIENKPI